MSDKEVILRLLGAAERRIRTNRILQNTSGGLAAALVIPVLFKIIDLISPFRGTTVAAFFTIWTLGTLGWLVWRNRGRDGLDRIAASVDQTADTHDQLKTAYWFIRNPHNSMWIDAQIERAAQNAGRLRIDALYPRRIPRTLYAAVSLILLLGILNFLPLPWNYNWFYLQGAPAFALTDAQRSLLTDAMQLLELAEESNETELADRLAQTIREIQDGTISQNQLRRSLSDLQQSLAEMTLDVGRMADGLERVANALEPAELTQPVAEQVFVLDLQTAAAEVRTAAARLDSAAQPDLQEMAVQLQEASEVAGAGLEELARQLAASAAAVDSRNMSEARQALEETALEFERLQSLIHGQQLRNDAQEQIAALQESVETLLPQPEEAPAPVMEGSGGEPDAEPMPGEGEAEGEEPGSGDRQGEEGQGQGQNEGEAQNEGDPQEGETEGEGEAEGEGEGEDQPGESLVAGTTSDELTEEEEEFTSLAVQLEMQTVPVRSPRGSGADAIAEASQRERSRLDYRNVPSQLSPAQKDLLNQELIPWEQRQYVRKYFESIRP